MIRVGTSGYSYDDWKGVVYPDRLAKKDFLKHYSNFFGITEINFTYYRLPDPGIFRNIIDKAPDDFLFSVKLSKEFTHERDKMSGAIDGYRKGIEPLIESDQLLTLLAQFPYSFKPDRQGYNHLKRIRKAFGELPVNVEFRNDYWINDRTFAFLQEQGLGYVCVDMPRLKHLVPPVVRGTTDLGYIRFHGRAAKHWWNPPKAYMRYDYLYEGGELEEWVEKTHDLENYTENIVVTFNNHFQGKSARNAVEFDSMLRGEGHGDGGISPAHFLSPNRGLFDN
ncbi:MAG: DUF72 domain-containing protein [Candidatus Bipolaricaulota bacterium]